MFNSKSKFTQQTFLAMAQFKSNFGFLQPFACVFMILVRGDFSELDLYESLLLRM